MRDCFARIDVAVKNVDTREHDILDSDDYFQYHGGMVATVRAPRRRATRARVPRRLVRPVARRSRARWPRRRGACSARASRTRAGSRSMIRHGYKGAFELSATVDYLFGYDATTGVVEDWMYEQVAERYLLDEDVARRSCAARTRGRRAAIAERLLEAADRGLWARAGRGDARARMRDALPRRSRASSRRPAT